MHISILKLYSRIYLKSLSFLSTLFLWVVIVNTHLQTDCSYWDTLSCFTTPKSCFCFFSLWRWWILSVTAPVSTHNFRGRSYINKDDVPERRHHQRFKYHQEAHRTAEGGWSGEGSAPSSSMWNLSFLAQLSCKLKWVFLITFCPVSISPSVCQ